MRFGSELCQFGIVVKVSNVAPGHLVKYLDFPTVQKCNFNAIIFDIYVDQLMFRCLMAYLRTAGFIQIGKNCLLMVHFFPQSLNLLVVLDPNGVLFIYSGVTKVGVYTCMYVLP